MNQAPKEAPTPAPVRRLDYARPAPLKTRRRGKTPLILSLVAMPPAALCLWVVSDSYLDPFAALAITPIWLASAGLGIAATVTLVASTQKPRSRGYGADMLQRAVAANVGFWILLGLSLFVFVDHHR